MQRALKPTPSKSNFEESCVTVLQSTMTGCFKLFLMMLIHINGGEGSSTGGNKTLPYGRSLRIL